MSYSAACVAVEAISFDLRSRQWRHLLQFVDASGHDGLDVLSDEAERPVPPGEGEKAGDVFVAEALTDNSRGISTNNGVVRDVIDHTGNGSVARWQMVREVRGCRLPGGP